MKKAIFALMMATAIGAASIAAPAPAEAQSIRQILRGIGIGAAVVGGALLFGHAARAHLDPRYHAWAPAEGYY
jgi:glycerol uptake facilitator-like aquaporin